MRGPATSISLSLEPAVSRVLFRRCRRWWSFLWAARCRTARATNSGSGVGAGHAGAANLAEGHAISDRSCSRWGLPAPLVTEGAVRFYRTFSPVPDALRRRAVCSLLHFPSSHLDWPLASTLPCGARTFLDGRPKATAATTCPARARSAITIPPRDDRHHGVRLTCVIVQTDAVCRRRVRGPGGLRSRVRFRLEAAAGTATAAAVRGGAAKARPPRVGRNRATHQPVRTGRLHRSCRSDGARSDERTEGADDCPTRVTARIAAGRRTDGADP